MNLTLEEIYVLFNAKREVRNAKFKVKSVSVDTRTMKRGDVFFALKGENTDGHKYIKKALAKGAALVVNEKRKGKKTIKVKSSKDALLKLTGYYCRKFKNLRTAGITGSNGKTTTKELAAAMLSRRFRVLKAEKSYNNYVGLPLTVFNLNKGKEIMVAELGMNRKGEIKKLSKTIKMDTAVITNIGRAHMGFFRDIKGIAGAKAEIIEGLRPGGTLVLNRDDRFFKFLKNKAKKRKLKVAAFGVKNRADIRISGIKEKGGKVKFTMNIKGKSAAISTRLKGVHNLYNIAAAAAVAAGMGARFSDIRNALKSFSMKGFMRFEEKKLKGADIINDSYNANPDSFRASVETIKGMKLKKLVVVTGDMLEQGKNTATAHAEAGRLIASLKPAVFFVFGRHARMVKKGYLKAGGKKERFVSFKRKKRLSQAVKKYFKPGNTVFIKGSRANRLEDVIK